MEVLSLTCLWYYIHILYKEQPKCYSAGSSEKFLRQGNLLNSVKSQSPLIRGASLSTHSSFIKKFVLGPHEKKSVYFLVIKYTHLALYYAYDLPE